MSSASSVESGAPLPNGPSSGQLEPAATYSRSWTTLRRHPLAWAGAIGIVLVVAVAFVGPLIYRQSAYAVNTLLVLHPPMAGHLLGTDDLGRDELARLMLGGQVSLEVGVTAAVASMVVGILYGLASGFSHPLVDAVMMRFVDVMRAIPALFLLIFMDSVFKPSVGLLIVLIALVSWNSVSRLVRAEVLTLRERTYVEASTAAGASRVRVALAHLLPNTMGTIVVASTFMVADSVLIVAALSFLGLGLPPPAPNWGSMLSISMSYLPQNAWWLVYPPGVMLLVTIVSVNFLGDAFRDAFDARLRQQ